MGPKLQSRAIYPPTQIKGFAYETLRLYRISLCLAPKAPKILGAFGGFAGPGIRLSGPWGRQEEGWAECELLDILRAYGGRLNHHRTSGTLSYEIPKSR